MHVVPWLAFPITILCLIFSFFMRLFSISLQLDVILIMSFLEEKEPPRIQNMFFVQAVNKAPVNKAPFYILWINGGKGVCFPLAVRCASQI